MHWIHSKALQTNKCALCCPAKTEQSKATKAAEDEEESVEEDEVGEVVVL